MKRYKYKYFVQDVDDDGKKIWQFMIIDTQGKDPIRRYTNRDRMTGYPIPFNEMRRMFAEKCRELNAKEQMK